MNTIILLKLLSAHFISDFFLQTDDMAMKKQTSWKFLVLHSFINAAVAYIIFGLWTMWIVPLVIFLSHFIIDWMKAHLGNDGTLWFIFDQVLHIGVIVCLWLSVFSGDAASVLSSALTSEKIWLTLTVGLIMTMPASMVIERFFRKWIPEVTTYSGLPGGGKWIGYLERLLIVAFVVTGNISGVGFLMTAKSVFRFSDVQKGDLRMTEYMLLGTLMSFSIAIAGGFIILALL